MPAANLEKLKIVKDVSRKETVFALARFPGTSRLAFAGSDFMVRDIDLNDPKPESKDFGSHGSYVTGLALAGSTLISGAYDGALIWWDTNSRSELRRVKAHAKWIRGVEASPGGTLVASVADDMVCRLWDVATGRLIHELKGHDEKTPTHYPSMLYACAFTPDGRHLATADKVGHIVVWDVAGGQKVQSVEAPGMYTWDPVQRRHSIGGIRSVAFSPDGAQLAAGGIGKIENIDHLDGKARVEIFDWRKGERTHEFPGDQIKGLVERLVYHPNGDWLFAAGGANDGFLMVLDIAAKKPLAQEKMPMHIHDLALNDAADTLYAVGTKKIAVVGMSG